jgi:hypothetical protein
MGFEIGFGDVSKNVLVKVGNYIQRIPNTNCGVIVNLQIRYPNFNDPLISELFDGIYDRDPINDFLNYTLYLDNAGTLLEICKIFYTEQPNSKGQYHVKITCNSPMDDIIREIIKLQTNIFKKKNKNVLHGIIKNPTKNSWEFVSISKKQYNKNELLEMSQNRNFLKKEEKKRKLYCHYCGKPGHIKPNCKKLHKSKQCYKCGKIGHIARFCGKN